METDSLDQILADWRRERPELNPAPLESVGRVLVLAQHLQRSVEKALSVHGISLGQFDILATLRRQGPEGRMTPKQLMRSVMLSSGGMTSRLDRLEEAGWIRRYADPEDRRGVLIALTAKGRRLIDAATQTRFAEAARSAPPFEDEQMQLLIQLLRKWLIAIEHANPDAAQEIS